MTAYLQGSKSYHITNSISSLPVCTARAYAAQVISSLLFEHLLFIVVYAILGSL